MSYRTEQSFLQTKATGYAQGDFEASFTWFSSILWTSWSATDFKWNGGLLTACLIGVCDGATCHASQALSIPKVVQGEQKHPDLLLIAALPALAVLNQLGVQSYPTSIRYVYLIILSRWNYFSKGTDFVLF